MNNRQFLYMAQLAIFGTFFVVIGIVVLSQGNVMLRYAAWIGGAAVIIHGISNIVKFFLMPKDSPKRNSGIVIVGLTNIAVGAIILFLTDITIFLLTFVFSVYVCFNAAVKVVDYISYRKNNLSGRLYILVSAIFYGVFGILMMFIPAWGETTLLIVSGIYCILYGMSQINDFVIQIVPRKAKNKIKRKIRIATPVFISSFMPLAALRKFNKFMETESENESKNPVAPELYKLKDLDPPDIEVLIHVADDGVGKMGHCDLYFEDEILCYGNYDLYSQHIFGGAGDGVLLITEKEALIRFMVTHDKQIIFSYGLRLNEDQKKAVRDEVTKLKGLLMPWKCKYELDLQENPDASILDVGEDYGSKLWNGARGKYYKFKSGTFKSFFVLSTNCTQLVDNIVGKAGADIIKINGIISPGSYYDYMQREYAIDGSMVVSRNVYTKQNTEGWKVKGFVPER